MQIKLCYAIIYAITYYLLNQRLEATESLPYTTAILLPYGKLHGKPV